MPIVYESASKGGGSGTVTSVTAADTSIVVAGTATDPTIATATLDVIATDHPPAAAWSNNAKKITSLANGAAAQDAAAFGQIPTTLQPTDPGTNKVWGSNGAGSSLGVLPPGFEIGYSQRTTNIAVASTTEASGTTILSPGALTFDGGAVLVEFFAPLVQTPSNAVAAIVIVSLFEGATQVSRLAAAETENTTTAVAAVLTGKLRFTPTAASHTYTVTAFATSTTGTPTVIAGAGGTSTYPPAFVRFTKV